MADTEGAKGLDEKALIQARAQRRLAARAREEAERQAREEAERKAREEVELRAKEAAERQAKEEAEIRERQEAERLAREEAERQAKEEAKRLAQEEAARRAHEEAERKVREDAEADERERAEIEIRVRALAEARAIEEAKIDKKPKIRYRRPVPWKPIALGAFAILVALPLILLHVLGLSMLIPAMEKRSSEWMHEPVAITSVHASLWPAPHLRLDNVVVGVARDIRIPSIRVMPEWSTLFGESKVIKSIEVEALAIEQDSLSRVPGWLHGNSKTMRVGRIVLNNVKVGVKGVELPPFAGEVALTDEGRFKRAHFRTLDRKLELDVVPHETGFELNLGANNWQPPLGPKLVFDDLAARALASREGMQVGDISGRLYGGRIKGTAQLEWGRRLRAEGNFSLDQVEMEGAAAVFTRDIALSGKLDAKGAYVLEAGELTQLFDAPRIKAEFSSRDGAVGTLDLAHALQSRAREYVGSGKTGYETLSGKMALAGNRYQFRQLKLDAGLLQASGEADIGPNQEVSGRADVGMQLKPSAIRSRFIVSGSLKRLVLKRAD